MTADKPVDSTLSLFERAAGVFDGWTDPDTGVRALRVFPPGIPVMPGRFSTVYHQSRCFLDGGRRVLLRETTPEGHCYVLLDLVTGVVEHAFPPAYAVVEVHDESKYALLTTEDSNGKRVVIRDMNTGQETASVHTEGWFLSSSIFLADGRRAVVTHTDGNDRREYRRTHFHLLATGEAPRIFLELEGVHANHLLGSPTDPNLVAYDAWPAPLRDVDQVITLVSLHSRINERVKLDDNALRPPELWGVRDHYVWTPDGTRIVSYLNRRKLELRAPFNHFEFDWWLSALDWRTGADLSAQYPPGRWGGHMQVTPDSRYILCCGGPGFDKLFAVEIAGLQRGWNEHIICSYPKTMPKGDNEDPFPYPFALPDGSGVIFNAGWPGVNHGVYLAAWPTGLR